MNTVMVTLRLRSIVWFATGAVLAVFATVLVTQAWQADAAAGLYAKVGADASGATLLRGKGVVSVSRSVVGGYKVEFDSSIEQCGWFATLNENGDGAAEPGEIAVEQQSAADPNSLEIRTFDSAGISADPGDADGFSVHVVC